MSASVSCDVLRPPVDEKRRLTQVIVQAQKWAAGDVWHTPAFLAAHPELADDREVVLELAYEEFCARQAAGEPVDATAFIATLDARFQPSFAKLLEVHDLFSAEPKSIPVNDALAWPAEGETLLDFQLLRDIGVGAFSRVYLAKQTALGDRPVALKISRIPTDEANILGK